jgi:hypothetical protein
LVSRYEVSKARYPDFYLLHGGGGDEGDWTNLGRAPEILNHLISQGKATPMIVVMTNENSNQIASPDVGVPPLGGGPAPALPRKGLPSRAIPCKGRRCSRSRRALSPT